MAAKRLLPFGATDASDPKTETWRTPQWGQISARARIAMPQSLQSFSSYAFVSIVILRSLKLRGSAPQGVPSRREKISCKSQPISDLRHSARNGARGILDRVLAVRRSQGI